MNYDLNFLKSKGFFNKEDLIIEKIFEDSRVVYDKENRLVYCEIKEEQYTTKKLYELKRKIEKEVTKRYKLIWFYIPKENKIKVFRKYGEIRWFYYNPKISHTDVKKSKEEKLEKFSVNNINILFDIRDVEKRFYNSLWEHRINIANSIKEIKNPNIKLLIAQRFIDKCVFLLFISQLGLIRIKTEEKEYVLNKFTSINFFKRICNEFPSEEDLRNFLNSLFYDVLGRVNINGYNSVKLKIDGKEYEIIAPSLNGGMFIEEVFESKKEREIRISGIKKLFTDLLLNYNWIIGEEIPEREDVIGDLTPEIIGHIYERFVVSLEQLGLDKLSSEKIDLEKLREGRKKIGAYYTPEEITNYISKNTIFPYIKDRLKEKFGEEGKKFFKEFFKKNVLNHKELEILKYLYFEILTKIKICDNACGSGSFLIAAGDLLLRLYSRSLYLLKKHNPEDPAVKKVLEEIKKAPSRNYYIVKKIILNNLYGVDIMEGAIEIAKLRLWLWLVSQVNPEKSRIKKIETLPNLDFNLMVGNSLIGFVDIENIEFDFLGKQKTLSFYLGKSSKIEWLKNLAKQKQEFKTLPAHEAVKFKEELNRELNRAREFLNEKFYNMLKAKGIKISKEEFLKLKPFHWGFEFYEVFNLEKPKEERGFDVIIGNPPYINIYNITEREKDIYSNLYQFAYKKYDIYILFIERSINLINLSGKLSYITSDKWIAEEYGYKLREFVKNTQNLREIVDFRHFSVFIGVGIRNVVFFLDKNKKYEQIVIKNPDFKLQNLLPYSVIKEHPRYHLRLDLSHTDLLIIYEILRSSIKLKDICYVNWGCRPSPSEKYVFENFEACFSRTKNKNLCKKLIKGADVGRYYFNWNGRWLAYLPDMYNPMFPELFESDRIIIKDIGIEPIKSTYVPGNEKIYSDHTTINLIKWECVPINKITKNISYNNFEKIDLKYILLLINSKLINYFIRIFLSDQLHVLPENTKNIPIKLLDNQQPFIILCDYMLFLNATEERRKKEKELIEFVDKQIIDSSVYELYFKEKFYEDKLYEKNDYILLKLIESYLRPINYNRWSELYWKKQLGENLSKIEEKDLKKLEEENLKTIKEVIEKIKSNEDILKQIEKIKNHPWIRIIEGKENK